MSDNLQHGKFPSHLSFRYLLPFSINYTSDLYLPEMAIDFDSVAKELINNSTSELKKKGNLNRKEFSCLGILRNVFIQRKVAAETLHSSMTSHTSSTEL